MFWTMVCVTAMFKVPIGSSLQSCSCFRFTKSLHLGDTTEVHKLITPAPNGFANTEALSSRFAEATS